MANIQSADRMISVFLMSKIVAPTLCSWCNTSCELGRMISMNTQNSNQSPWKHSGEQ